MSTANESSDFATFVRAYRSWGESKNPRLEGNPHPLAASQHTANQVQHPIAQRLSPPRPRLQPYRQPLRNSADVPTFAQTLDDVKKRQDEITVAINELSVALNAMRTITEQIQKTVNDGVEAMVGTMNRFETVGRGVLEMALPPSNLQPSSGASSHPQASNPPQPSQHAPQPPIFSNPQKTYQGPNTTQPPAPFFASSNPTQSLYAPPASQPPESYSEQYIDYNGLEFFGNETS